MHDNIIQEVSKRIAEVKEQFLKECAKKVLPPVLYRAVEKKLCYSLVEKYLRLHDIHVRVNQLNYKHIFMCDGKPIGEFFIVWGIPPIADYIIYDSP